MWLKQFESEEIHRFASRKIRLELFRFLWRSYLKSRLCRLQASFSGAAPSTRNVAPSTSCFSWRSTNNPYARTLFSSVQASSAALRWFLDRPRCIVTTARRRVGSRFRRLQRDPVSDRIPAVDRPCEPSCGSETEHVEHRISRETKQYSKVIVWPNGVEYRSPSTAAVLLLASQNLTRSGLNYRRGARFRAESTQNAPASPSILI